MKVLIMIIAFIPLLFACNAAEGDVRFTSENKTTTELKFDSAHVVEGSIEWQKLFAARNEDKNNFVSESIKSKSKEENIKEVTLGAGCFWCIEACFQDVEGIVSVVPGYAGGKVINPTYEQVCTGSTGHAEVARIIYDESIISFDEILEMFWFVHDPTQLNRQGNDVGTQYRSVIFYHSLEQKEIAEKYKAKLLEEKVWDKPIVTEITAINNYSEAEQYHHDYLKQNPDNSYCRAVVKPKVDKFKKVFHSKIK